MKKCCRCGQEKTLDSFYNRKNSKDGKAYECIDCAKFYNRKHREKNGNWSAKQYKENPEYRKKQLAGQAKRYKEDAEFREKRKRITRENGAKLVKEYRDWTYTQKTPCVICGESDPAVIDFHHLDPSEKSFNIGSWAECRSLSKADIINEIGKCVCLCANDHRRLHLGLISLPQEHLKD